MSSSRYRRVSLTALSLVILAGCGSGSAGEDDAVAVPLPQIAFSNVWSADPGLDLFSRGAELIRATREAGELASRLGIEYSFPGYADALPQETDNQDFDYNGVVVGRQAPEGQGPFTIYRHLSDLVVTDSTVSATVCAYFIHSVDGVWSSGEDLSFASRIALVNNGESPGMASLKDLDTSANDLRATMPPDWNVFGSWEVTEFRTATANEVPDGCTRWWQERFPSYVTRKPGDKTLIPPSGYVRPVMPVAAQFPEWVGPSNVP